MKNHFIKNLRWQRIAAALVLALLMAVLVMPRLTVQAQSNGARECRLFSSNSDGLILVDVPEAAVPDGGVFCRFIAREGIFIADRGEIGNQSVLNSGVVHAVEVYGLLGLRSITRFETPVRICMKGTGALLFLDASESLGRVARALVSFTSGEFTCADLSFAGTVILVNSTTIPAASNATPGGSGTLVAPAAGTIIPLTGCRVTTRAILNLRAEPSTAATIITTVPYNVTLQVTERTEGWYRVVFESTQGWLTARFLNRQGTCQ